MKSKEDESLPRENDDDEDITDNRLTLMNF
jgi:hypothetical protein